MFTDGLIEALLSQKYNSAAGLAAAIDAELRPNLRDDVAFTGRPVND